MVKPGNYGQSAKFEQRPCLFHILNIGIKDKLTKLANSEIPNEAAHKEPSHLDFHCLQMYVQICLMSEVTDFTLVVLSNRFYETNKARLNLSVSTLN